MTTRLDVVTVVFSADLRLLELQARSLARFADPGVVGTIHVIVNDPCFRAVRRAFRGHVLPEYGALKTRVKLWDYRTLWPGGARRTGWLSQQALKLMAARLVETEDFLILDAKNHFVRPVAREDFFTSDGRLRSHMYRIHPSFEDHFKRACRYFGDEREPDLTTGLPTATPFLMKRSLASAMMAEIEEREGRPFPDYFMTGRPFTEFYLYYGYLLARHGDIGQFYERRPLPTATLFGAQAPEVREAAEILAQLDHRQVYCMGVHRAVLREADPDVIGLVKAAWARFGLVTDADEQTYFTTYQESLPAWRRFLPF